jgi:hypothetical protein
MTRISKLGACFVVCNLLGGCASLGKGMVDAYFERQAEEDTRVCEIIGKPFEGITPYLDQREGKTKVLIIHGIRDHLPGYATQFVERLSKELDLPLMSSKRKNIHLVGDAAGESGAGAANLGLYRLMSQDKTRELLFYELTWSPITAKQKEAIAFDNTDEYAYRRADLNNLLKKFSNETWPDSIIYIGESRNAILQSFSQALCWMVKSDWSNFPDDATQACSFQDSQLATNLRHDHFAFITHSLGSRIAMDGLQSLAASISACDASFQQVLKNKKIPVFMMSNQLPMLQLGRSAPKISNQVGGYCKVDGDKYGDRVLSATSVVAFSDPNDLLSYTIPSEFVEKYLDSRLCPEVTNININVASIINAFSLGKMANPLQAHIGYDADDRVVALIAKGIGNARTAQVVKERCRWVQTID